MAEKLPADLAGRCRAAPCISWALFTAQVPSGRSGEVVLAEPEALVGFDHDKAREAVGKADIAAAGKDGNGTSMQVHSSDSTVTATSEPAATDAMRTLAASTGGTVLLVGWSDDSLSCRLRCDPPPQPLAIPQMEGPVLLPGTEALLHVLLAWSPPVVLDRRLSRLQRAPMGVRNRAILAMRLARVRATGHDFVTGGLRDEVTSIASPVRDDHGEVVASLALVAPSVYLENLDVQTIAADLMNQAADLRSWASLTI